jgi:hypothetical protein
MDFEEWAEMRLNDHRRRLERDGEGEGDGVTANRRLFYWKGGVLIYGGCCRWEGLE